MIDLVSVSYRDFTKHGMQVFMYTLVITLPFIILTISNTAWLVNRVTVFFLFMPAITLILNFIVNTLRWLIEYILCALKGEIYKSVVTGYDHRSIIVKIADSFYKFEVEVGCRKYKQGSTLDIKIYKKFACIQKEGKRHARRSRNKNNLQSVSNAHR